MLTNTKTLIARFERQVHRMGELWERCQGSGWPDAESAEFTSLRDERLPPLRAAIEAIEDAVTAPLLDRIAELETELRASDEKGRAEIRARLRDCEGWERECLDTDELLSLLGLDPADCRTDGGSLKISAVVNQLARRALPDLTTFEAAVREYIEEYEMQGETEEGRDAYYAPNENDKALLLDAIMGFDFSPWLYSAPVAPEQQYPKCNCPKEGFCGAGSRCSDATEDYGPCGHFLQMNNGHWIQCKDAANYTVPLYTSPPKSNIEGRISSSDRIGADRLAVAVARLVSNRSIDSRSEAADALLDYLDVGGVCGPSDVTSWLAQYENESKKDK